MTSNSLFASRALTSIAAGLCAVVATFATISTVRAETGAETGIADFRDHVESGIDRTLRLPQGIGGTRQGIATVAVTVDARGRIETADLVESSGVAAFDREALRTARTVSYPATGKSRTVAMVLGFNQPVSGERQRTAEHLVTAWREERRVMFANKNAARQPDS